MRLPHPALERLAYRVRDGLWALSDCVTRLRGGPRLYVVNEHDPMICCTMRDDDLLRMRRWFRLNGFVEVHRPERADVILLNTCAFDEGREATCLDLIGKYRALPGELVVTGCIGKINQDAMLALFDGPYVSPPELDELLDGFMKAHCELKVPFRDVAVHGSEGRLYDGGVGWRSVTRPRRRKPGAVKVVNGCPQNCAYCTHKMAIGFKPVSMPLEKIVARVFLTPSGRALAGELYL